MAVAAMRAPSIRESSCDRLRVWLQQTSGILVPPDRNYLFKERLSELAEDLRSRYPEACTDLDQLAEFLLSRQAGDAVIDKMITAMTTNESTWFRDVHPFEALRTEILPAVCKKSRRVWSAACSYGQEIYSLAILLEEERAWSGGCDNWQLFASDLDEAALERGLAAHYRGHEIARGLSPHRRDAFFERNGDMYCLKSKLRQAVRFERRSLMDRWPPEPNWDIILCRNVLIYFSPEDRLRVLQELTRRLAPGGALLLGAMEIYPEDLPGLERVRSGQTSYWRKK